MDLDESFYDHDDDVNNDDTCLDYVTETVVPQILQEPFSNNEGSVKLVVKTSEVGVKDYSKTYACFVCGEEKAKMARHLWQRHSTETMVARAMSFPIGSKQRRLLFKKLLHLGDFYKNIQTLKNQSGLLRIARRPSSDKQHYRNYSPCPYCLGFFVKSDLWRHCYSCPFKDGEPNLTNITKVSALLLYSSLEGTSNPNVIKALSTFKSDEVGLLIRNDPLLKAYLSCLLLKDDFCVAIANRIRTCARLLLAARRISKTDICMKDLITPKNWDLFINAMKSLGGFTETEGKTEISTPSLCIKLGYNIKALASVLKGMALRDENDYLVTTANKFIELYSAEWPFVASRIDAYLKERRDSVPEKLPLIEDLVTLKTYCQERLKLITHDMANKHTNHQCWAEMCKLIIARLLLLNGRRGSEPSKLTIDIWTKAKEGKWVNNEEIESIENKEDKDIAKNLILCYITGKRQRKVPMIIPKEITPSIDMLISKRSYFNISPSNPYVFAVPKTLQTYKGWHCLDEISRAAQVKRPDLITSTKLRKTVATSIQHLDMSEAEIRWMADHLGHSMEVHKKHYRLSEGTVEVTKVAKILMACEQGNLQTFRNRKAEEITLQVKRLSVFSSLRNFKNKYNSIIQTAKLSKLLQ